VPELLLQDTNPYRTRRASLWRGDDDAYLYLEDLTGERPSTVSAVWVANSTPAPPRAVVPLDQSAPARMMARGTRFPDGCPPLDGPRLVWFEEGDGVALVDRAGLVAAVPGWAGHEGFYGYSRWALGRSPLAWEMSGEIEASLVERVRRSDDYWHWRLAPGARAWDEICSDGLDHLTRTLGPAEDVRDGAPGRFPELALSRHRAGTTDVWVTATTGLSGARMPGVEQLVDDPGQVSRIELAIARDQPDEVGFQLLASLATIPFGRSTWLGEGHTIGGGIGSFPSLGDDCAGVLLTTHPPGRFPDLSGPERRGDPIRYLWVVGIDAATFSLVRARGSAAALSHLAQRGDTFVNRSRAVATAAH
jgi:hypothetical protein